MSHFLVYTDFSSNSTHAVRFAVQFCMETNSRLTVLHSLKAKTNAGMLMSIDARLKDEALAEMENLKSSLTAEFGKEKLDFIQFKVKKGEFLKSIQTSYKRTKAELVFIASKSEYEDEEVSIGNLAGSLIKQTHVPCVLVPYSSAYQGFSNILFSMRKTKVCNKSTIRPLSTLRKFHNSTIDILNVLPGKSKDSVLGPIIRKLNPRIFTNSNNDILEATMEFLKDKNYDLLCVIRRKKGFFSNFLITTQVEKRIFDVSIPVLVLHGKYD